MAERRGICGHQSHGLQAQMGQGSRTECELVQSPQCTAFSWDLTALAQASLNIIPRDLHQEEQIFPLWEESQHSFWLAP